MAGVGLVIPLAMGWLMTQAMLFMMAPGVIPGHNMGAEAANILGIFPTPSISHQLPFQAIMKALAARGHQITVISPDSLKEPVANYTDIDLSFSYPTFRKLSFVAYRGTDTLTLMSEMQKLLPEIIDEQLSSQQIQDFLRNSKNKKYDLVMLEFLGYQAYYGLIHAIGSPPIIGVLSLGGFGFVYNAMGNPNNPAINPEPFYGYTDRMSFWQRAHNTYVSLRMLHMWETIVKPAQLELMRKHFGDSTPTPDEIERNISALLLSNHWTTEYPRALLPNIISLTGLHINAKPAPLPKDLHQWLDEAEHGVVYFSLGSNVQSRDLPPVIRDAILRAITRLPQRVLWKFEDDALPGKPDNLRISKWLPQQSVLAHPKIRMFITQGGLQSFQEAVFHGVPLLGIPFLGDQKYNVMKMEAAKIGRMLDINNLTEYTLYEEITTLIQDKGYKDRMSQLSAEFREHKATSLDTAVWWTEYVLRHNGARHLRSAALDLRWYQYLLLDVVAAILAAVAIFVFSVYVTCRAIFCRRRGSSQHSVSFSRKQQ